jgi:ABC-type molybdate transport system permease subunit
LALFLFLQVRGSWLMFSRDGIMCLLSPLLCVPLFCPPVVWCRLLVLWGCAVWP